MAVTTTTTKSVRLTMGLRNGGNRKIDIDNPANNSTITSQINVMNDRLQDTPINGGFREMVTSEDYFYGDTDAVVTAITNAEIIEVTKTTTTTNVFTG